VWLSPEGCMMFSTSLHFPPTSSINSCVSILQHVMGTAVVHAVRTMDGYQVNTLCLVVDNFMFILLVM
jgi:biotin-(acetyl-CoA carboxylase) ligase